MVKESMTTHIPTSLFMAVLAAPIVFVALVSSASAGGQPEAGEITGVVWKWQQTRYNNDTQNVPSDPSLYLSLIHISEPTRLKTRSRMPSSA